MLIIFMNLKHCIHLIYFVLITNVLTYNLNTDNKKYFNEEYERLKQQAIIDAFKLKLLKLLDVDTVPPSVFTSNMTNPVPEPILTNYEDLIKSQTIPSSKKRNIISRKSRNKEIKQNVVVEEHELNEEEEMIKLNGSLVQRVTLLPSKLDDSYDWCNELFVESKRQSHHHHKKNPFLTLNCILFDLNKQKEFVQNSIKSADLYLKINFNKNLNYDLASHIYLEVNGNLIKRINLIKIEPDEYDDKYDSSDRDSVFDSADITKKIKEVLSENKENILRVKILLKNDYLDTDVTELRGMFADLEDNIALHVKFGGLKISTNKISKRSISHNKKQNNSKNNNVFKDCSELRKSGFKSTNYSCCRETLMISMDQIGWSHFILSPKVIEYKYCRGGCLSGAAQVFSNTNIVYKVFEINHSFESAHCCNIHDYEDEITITYGSPPNYLTKMVSLNAKSCLCS
ncbi:unnamed protein product [Brachionus calyciflorus]|uniref:TGF-beta family profile domain-containing protein n=1 Tax=Brachionus calyciflorus TaxID=104777 RepID=A0A814FHS8_9BILA|nr:unnamed protein product [Brachionus calyciflorus]